MIARMWRGITRAEDSDAYRAYLERTGLAAFRETDGNRGALVLRRVDSRTAEFLLISFWTDFDAIRRFAGADVEKAVYYPEDERFLLGKEPHVTHYEIVEDSTPHAMRDAALSGARLAS